MTTVTLSIELDLIKDSDLIFFEGMYREFSDLKLDIAEIMADEARQGVLAAATMYWLGKASAARIRAIGITQEVNYDID